MLRYSALRLMYESKKLILFEVQNLSVNMSSNVQMKTKMFKSLKY